MADKERHGIEVLTQFAMEVIRRSGEEALLYYGKGNSRIKFDEELVTEADFRLMEFFQDQLNHRFPEHQVFKNNQSNTDYTHDEKRYIWIFDPLDGVANFQAGIPIWGISLALIENFWPINSLRNYSRFRRAFCRCIFGKCYKYVSIPYF